MKRGEELFKAASNIINGERQTQYGDPEDAFAEIGATWACYLSNVYNKPTINISGPDVAIMMALLKLVRESYKHKQDNVIDAAGYLAIYYDMMSQNVTTSVL